MRQRLAWVLFLLTVLVSVAHVCLLVASSEPMLGTAAIGEGFPLVTVGAVAGAGVGALIVSRYPGHPVGWLFVGGQLLSEVGLALGSYGHLVLAGELDGPGGHLATWLSIQAGGLFVVSLLAVVFLLAPDGHLVSPRWRWVLAVTLGGLLAGAAGVAMVPPSRLDQDGQLVGAAPAGLNLLLVGASLAVAVGVLSGAAAVVVRLRRATGDRRQQLRWVALAAGTLAAGVLVNLLLALVGAPTWSQSIPVMAAYAFLPVCIGIAILRHRLFDIDVFINRAIVLTVLTGLVTAGYVGLVVLLSSVLPIDHDALWLPLLATAVVALVFQPVREGAQGLADRVVYGRRAAPYVELAEFSKRLQRASGTGELLRQVEDSIAGAVGARRVTLAVGGPGDHDRLRAADPDTAHPTVVLPVTHGAERLGTLTVTMPPDRPLRTGEQGLLTDFAVQVGSAFRNLRLESALADRVAELSARTRALEASARRLLVAEDAERGRFEAELGRTVVPHLRVVEEGLAGLLGPAGPERLDAVRVSADLLDDLTARIYAALEALRTLTRGIFPAQLARRGLAPALTSDLQRTGSGVVISELGDTRFDPRVESAAYFCVVELANVVRSPLEVVLRAGADGGLHVEARSDEPVRHDSTFDHLEDRAAALGGRLRICDGPVGVEMAVDLPRLVGEDADLVPDASE